MNLGKYDYTLREWDDPEMTFFELRVPKFMDTSLLDVNINPKWLSIRIKGKLTQIKLMEEIVVDKSIIQRSQMTGTFFFLIFLTLDRLFEHQIS